MDSTALGGDGEGSERVRRTSWLISSSFALLQLKPPVCFLSSPLGGTGVVEVVAECRVGVMEENGVL